MAPPDRDHRTRSLHRCVDCPRRRIYSCLGARPGEVAGLDWRFRLHGVGVDVGRVAMRRVNGLPLGILFLIAGFGILPSCDEDSVVTNGDLLGPSTEVVFPVSTLENRADISDSVDIYVTAGDDRGVSKVEIWTASEEALDTVLLAELTEPMPAGQIPEDLRPEEGTDLFSTRWYTRLIRNGTIIRLFSRAYDEAGNNTRSDVIVVRILNEGGDLFPPNAEFIVSPSRGTIEDTFRFDASSTTDEIDDAEQIFVRWDFDGDGVWEHDFDEELPATVVVEHHYSRARVYTVRLEAKNTYLPDQVGQFERAIEVNNVGGDPVPPEPEEMISIPAGTYKVGTADTSLVYADDDEFPLHEARMTTNFFIRRTEVPNRLYLTYLQDEMEQSVPKIRREDTQLFYYPNTTEPVEEDSLPQMILDLDLSEIFFDPDGDTMAVSIQGRELPVIGVTWFGAKSYAEHFGLRLPTEHEWEIAAKGDNEEYQYPWGMDISPEQANYNYMENPIRAVVPIGSYPNAMSPFGLLDLSGNAKEWVKDWYAPYQGGLQSNPEGPRTGEQRIVRGGGYLNSDTGVRVTGREAAEPETASRQIGFRTAYTPPETTPGTNAIRSLFSP